MSIFKKIFGGSTTKNTPVSPPRSAATPAPAKSTYCWHSSSHYSHMEYERKMCHYCGTEMRLAASTIKRFKTPPPGAKDLKIPDGPDITVHRWDCPKCGTQVSMDSVLKNCDLCGVQVISGGGERGLLSAPHVFVDLGSGCSNCHKCAICGSPLGGNECTHISRKYVEKWGTRESEHICLNVHRACLNPQLEERIFEQRTPLWFKELKKLEEG